MPYLVIFAETMTVAFLVLFSGLVLGLQRDSEGLPKPRHDIVGSVLVGSARLALMVGAPLLYAVEAAYLLGVFG